VHPSAQKIQITGVSTKYFNMAYYSGPGQKLRLCLHQIFEQTFGLGTSALLGTTKM
jgi:hypothetical protein